jgi:DNA-binding response OmpR family regulator
VKILCIDDAPDILEVLELSFKLKWPDVKVIKAGDGPAGLAAFKKEIPDLLVVDLGMPGMDGYEVIRQIRLTSKVPIIILSVRDEEKDIAKGLQMGADDYIVKPFGHLQLFARVDSVLRRAAAPQSPE